LVCVTIAVGLGGYFWLGRVVPEPPEIALAEAHPEVAAAVEKARLKVRQEPRSAAAWGALGQLLRACDFPPEAAVCFAEAERLAPTEARWPYLCGESLTLRGTLEAALPHLRRAVELSSGHETDAFAPRLRLAETLLAVGQFDEAEGLLQ